MFEMELDDYFLLFTKVFFFQFKSKALYIRMPGIVAFCTVLWTMAVNTCM